MEAVDRSLLTPNEVHKTLKSHMLVDGMQMVLDLENSKGIHLVDQKTNKSYVDFFGFFASNAIGMNHPKMRSDADFMKRLTEAALCKVTNSDVYTLHMARFVQTFGRVGIPSYLPYTFFVSGGALAVENALKTAFDWKVRKNFKKGYRRELGSKVLHFDKAFHGRSGYTLSLTNTADPRKTQYFPKFDWPRVQSPMIEFPLTEETLADVIRREQETLAQAKIYFQEYKDDIACVIVEPLQGEGGDNHFRPEFLHALKALAHENDALLIFDEVQSGVGITGKFWAHQTHGVEPDIISFGKKTQVCGILAGPKLDEVDGHVFQTASRINSTWGGNLVDMVRFDRILEIIEEDNLVQQAAEVGEYLRERLVDMAEQSAIVSNARGAGLMCAFDLPDAHVRDAFLDKAFEKGIIMLGCGTHSVRFRPPLTVTRDEIDAGLEMVNTALNTL
ncbi:MAG: L-lysine 6-transaminase [Rhodothermales bacterium]